MIDTQPVSAEFDQHAERYDEELALGLSATGETKTYFARKRVAWLRQRLQFGFPVATILDFGCGTGGSANWLQEEFPMSTYVGYDPSASSVGCAARTHSGAHRVRFVDNADLLGPSGFDLAFTNGVFHHIPLENRKEAMALVFRALKPGGWFAFWENNRWNPVVHLLMSRVPFDADAQMLFPFQARRLLREAGFEVVSTDSLFVFPAALKFLRWLEPWLCKVPVGGQYLVLARKPL